MAIAVEQAVRRHRRRAPSLLRRLRRGRAGKGDDPPEHVDERAGERQVRPAGVGGDMEEDEPALAGLRRGDQRRAVGERRPGPAGKRPVRLGEHLALDEDVGRHGQRRQRDCLAEKLASGCGSCQVRLPPSTRSPWRSCTGTSASVAAARRGPAKRTRVPPPRTQLASCSSTSGGSAADVGHGDDAGAGIDQLGNGHGRRSPRAARARRRRAGRRGRCSRAARAAAAPCRRDPPERRPMRRRRQRSSRSCTAPAVSAPAISTRGDIVAELHRQRELCLRRRGAGGKGERRVADRAALDVAGADDTAAGPAAVAANDRNGQRIGAAQAASPPKARAAGVGIDRGRRPDLAEKFGEGDLAVAAETVGEPGDAADRLRLGDSDSDGEGPDSRPRRASAASASSRFSIAAELAVVSVWPGPSAVATSATGRPASAARRLMRCAVSIVAFQSGAEAQPLSTR